LDTTTPQRTLNPTDKTFKFVRWITKEILGKNIYYNVIFMLQPKAKRQPYIRVKRSKHERELAEDVLPAPRAVQENVKLREAHILCEFELRGLKFNDNPVLHESDGRAQAAGNHAVRVPRAAPNPVR
jgi:hypothetical protein